MEQIARFTTWHNVSFTATASTTGGFAFSNYAGAILICNSTGTLTFYTTAPGSTTRVPITDAYGAPVTVTVSSAPSAVPLPDACFSCHYVAATSSAGTINATVCLKG